MGKWLHRVSNIDFDSLTGDCSTCGRVRLKVKKGGRRFACAVSEQRWCDGQSVSKRRAARRRQTRKLLAKLLSSGCRICRVAKKGIHCHHLDSSTKSFNISQGYTDCSRELLIAELKKCIAVCQQCHTKIHFRQFVVSEDLISEWNRDVDVLFTRSSMVEPCTVNAVIGGSIPSA